jgi:hypothetical protein
MIGPAMLLAAIANLAYYRTTAMRVFVWPGFIVAATFGIWQVVFLLYLGPDSAAANLVALREASAGAAAVFAPDAMRRAAAHLLSLWTYGGALALALPYAVVSSLDRSRRGQQWGVLTLFVITNLAWFVLASIGWARYAFPGVALAGLLVAKLALDLIDGARLSSSPTAPILRRTVAGWAAVVLVAGTLAVAVPIVTPPENSPVAMGAHLNRDVPLDAVVETWEPELGALTAHNYHYPPNTLLAVAVAYIWRGGPPPHLQYDPLETKRPPYVVVGPFAKWVKLYPEAILQRDYLQLRRSGSYDLYQRRDLASASPDD